MRLALRAAAALFLCAAFATAASADPAGFAFLKVPAGARASALGGAYASLADGVEAVFWNPAALERVKGIQISGSHYEYLEKIRHDQFAIGGRLFGGGIAASLRALYSEPIEERDALGNLIGTFGSHDLEISLGYGRKLSPGVTLGATTQLVRERIADQAATTMAFGLGTAWDPAMLPGLRLSLSAHNLGPAAHYTIDGAQGTPVRLPSAIQAGGSYGFGVGGGFDLRGALESRFSTGQAPVAMLGAELAHPSGAAVRAGMTAGDTESALSFGVGWAVQSLHLDYAFVPFKSDLGDTHRFSLAAQF